MQTSAKKKRVAVIGCGPSGISILVALMKSQQSGDEIPEIVCFEKQSSMGGLWIFDWRVGVNEYGAPVTSPMYRDLRLNSPKEVEEYYDYTFEEHFQKPIPSYCKREFILDYFVARAKRYQIEQFVKFSTVVKNVKKVDGGDFLVTYEQLSNDETIEERFDYVVVASGLHTIPKFPIYSGIDTFPGRVIHSTNFKRSDELKSVDCLLIIGTSFSAMDIATFHYQVGGKKTLLSYHGEKPKYDLRWPDSVNYVTDLVEITGPTCIFKDGSRHEVDMIVFATGYKAAFPFLDRKLRIEANGYRFMHEDLYKGVVLQKEPCLFYIGMVIPIFTFGLYERQAWFIKELLVDRVQLPSSEERRVDIDVWLQKARALPKKRGPLTNDSIFFNLLLVYMRNIVEGLKYPDNIDLQYRSDIQHQNCINRSKNVITFRDVQFLSQYTGAKNKLAS